MKRIGFVDYYLSEWHANNYPAWIKEVNERLGTDYEISYGWAELDISPVDGISTDEWCKNFGVERCATLKELCEKSDVIIILAPTNPEKHLPYAKEVLTYGKPTYIDKTFAPNLAEAKEIFAVAKEYSTPFFSTSALRYASELENFKGGRDITISGGGSNLPEYIIHIVEMGVKLFTEKVTEVKVEKQGAYYFCRLKHEDESTSTFMYGPMLPYALAGANADSDAIFYMVQSDFFKDLMADIIRFFEEPTPPFDTAQTLEVMRIRDAIIKGSDELDTWIKTEA